VGALVLIGILCSSLNDYQIHVVRVDSNQAVWVPNCRIHMGRRSVSKAFCFGTNKEENERNMTRVSADILVNFQDKLHHHDNT